MPGFPVLMMSVRSKSVCPSSVKFDRKTLISFIWDAVKPVAWTGCADKSIRNDRIRTNVLFISLPFIGLVEESFFPDRWMGTV